MDWFVSDTHYKHKNIVKGVSNWSDTSRCRPFDTLEEHDDTLVNNINACVNKNDTLWHMGDWSFGGIRSVLEFRERLNCKNIIIVCGNHDHHIRNNRAIPIGDPQDVKEGIRAHTLFTKVREYRMVKIQDQPIVMSHYAMRVWEGSHKGFWMLHGHSHGSLNNDFHVNSYYAKMKTMDVGIDTHPEFRPYSFDEIKIIMDERETILIDHHDENTNVH